MISPKVVFVDQTAQLGGAELSLLDLVRYREGPSHVVLFEEGPFSPLLRDHDISVEICPIGKRAAQIRKGDGLFGKVASARGIASLIRRLRPILARHDVVLANTSKAMVVSSLANLGSTRPLIYHLRDIISADHLSRINQRVLISAANRCATKVITNSQATADAFITAGGQAHKVVVIPNGFDPTPFEAAFADRPRLRTTLRSECGFNDGDKLVALVGRLAEWKGQHIAIEALQELPDVHLLLVGDALFGEVDYKQRLQNFARELGIADRVHHLGFRDDIPSLLQAVDAVIHTSTVPEPFGRVIVEAMLSQVPIIASNGGGAAEIVTDGETGLLTEMGSVSSLAAAIKAILDDPRRSQQMVDKAFVIALEGYGIERVVKRIDAVISEVLEAS